MSVNLATMVEAWDNSLKKSLSGERYDLLYERLLFYARHKYWQYLPTMGSEHADFEQRLSEWIGMVPDNMPGIRRLLLELAAVLNFYAREDFDKLHQAAFRGPVTSWIIDTLNLDFVDPHFDVTLDNAIHRGTWYCGLSDSMAIADFHHVNNLGGINFRPDIRTLKKFSSIDQVVDFMQNHRDCNGPCPLSRLVILEDFIGAGWQLEEDATPLIGELVTRGIPTLLVPLIICPPGDQTLRALAVQLGPTFRYEPVLALTERAFVTPQAMPSDQTLHERLRRIARGTYAQVQGNRAAAPLYGPFGSGDTGALVVMFSNTPANTLPLIQHVSNSWSPLFPRSARVR